MIHEDVEDYEDIESDEAFSFHETDESVDEADEAMDETDEGFDEAMDEAAVLSTQSRLDDARRRMFGQRLEADRARELRLASATTRDISDRIRSIQNATRAGMVAVRPLRGTGVITATLEATGRRARMRMSPALATSGELNELRTMFNTSERRSAAIVSRLSAAQAASAKALTAERVKVDAQMRQQIGDVYKKLDTRISTELSGQKTALEKERKRMMTVIKRHKQRAFYNSLCLATAPWVFTSFGKAGRPKDPRNLILTALLMGAVSLDDIADRFAGKNSKGVTRSADIWSLSAPIINPLGAFLLFKDSQNERFIAGVSPITGASGTITIPVASNSQDAFKKLNNVPAVAVIASGTNAGRVKALVDVANLKINITLEQSGTTSITNSETTNIAWIVDTDPPN